MAYPYKTILAAAGGIALLAYAALNAPRDHGRHAAISSAASMINWAWSCTEHDFTPGDNEMKAHLAKLDKARKSLEGSLNGGKRLFSIASSFGYLEREMGGHPSGPYRLVVRTRDYMGGGERKEAFERNSMEKAFESFTGRADGHPLSEDPAKRSNDAPHPDKLYYQIKGDEITAKLNGMTVMRFDFYEKSKTINHLEVFFYNCRGRPTGMLATPLG